MVVFYVHGARLARQCDKEKPKKKMEEMAFAFLVADRAGAAAREGANKSGGD